MKFLCTAISSLIFSLAFSQYQPTWESLDSRPVPQWYKDAKFGIFIHWGVYSVPGWSSKGSYAEWYQYGLQTNDTARQEFHKKKFGNLSYYQLADQFKAELFQPDEWAKLFEASGAKYIVLTSKHHDGFCLWPNKTANKTWGFNWNAGDVGPHRDLLGDLFKAVRKTSVHAGMYYSLFEWFNPLWQSDKKMYLQQHLLPQMKELINIYQPDVFWTDGDWMVTDDVWNAKQFLQWVYNESPVKNNVVTYDRWGSNIRFKHGAVFTPEYQPDLDFDNHYFEESRGMGSSYGYNREEDAWDYNSAQSLIIALIDKVSRGGNFLLDIGPDEHGKIPPIMQERLLQIGEWLKQNGEAIYGASRWKIPFQWSEGNKQYQVKENEDPMLKMTVDPAAGYAVKEIFYTYNATGNTLYAIFPKYPASKQLKLHDVKLVEGTIISSLWSKQTLIWKQDIDNVIINLPAVDPGSIKFPSAFVIKIANYGAFIKKPLINISYKAGSLIPTISINADKGTTTRYTLDNSEPTITSTIYTHPFAYDRSTVIKAKSFDNIKVSSATAEESIIRYQWMNAVNESGLKPGISYNYYEPSGHIKLSDLDNSPVVKSGTTNHIGIEEKIRKEKFGLSFNGFIKVESDGFYTFFLQSDDGSKLFIDDVEVVNNDGDHGMFEKSGRAVLKKGFHKISVKYFDSGGDNGLTLYIQPEGGVKQELPANNLFHK